MPEDRSALDCDIILSAYAERLREAFRIFAENLGAGQQEKGCKERFLRQLDLIRKARDLALEVATGADMAAPAADERADAAARERSEAELLSDEDKALIEQAVAGTTGAAPARPPSPLRPSSLIRR